MLVESSIVEEMSRVESSCDGWSIAVLVESSCDGSL